MKIAHASIDERGMISGGNAGDQTGKEVCMRDWYSKPWNVVLRLPPIMGVKAAECMKKAVNNPRIGYDQGQRNTLLNYARNVGYDPSKVTTPCETDCSALVTLACIYAGIPEKQLVVNGNSATTSTLRRLLGAEELTGKEYTAKKDNLLTGDILLSEGHHVAVVVEVDMKTSKKGIDLIKSFEGCRLTAYKAVPSEQYYTIGYGHYGPDVSPGTTITQDQAEILLGADLRKYEQAVDKIPIQLNQNQYDALVSFAYNCGIGNLNKLVSGRDLQQIADALLLYNKSGGHVLEGLARRRRAERDLFTSGGIEKKTGNPYPEPTKSIRYNSKGNDVRWLQVELNRFEYKLIVDGIAKDKTIDALIDFQKKAFPNNPGEWDGVCGPKTREALKNS